MNGYTHSMVVTHQSIPASLPAVAAHTSRVVAVVVTNDLVTMWLVIVSPAYPLGNRYYRIVGSVRCLT